MCSPKVGRLYVYAITWLNMLVVSKALGVTVSLHEKTTTKNAFY